MQPNKEALLDDEEALLVLLAEWLGVLVGPADVLLASPTVDVRHLVHPRGHLALADGAFAHVEAASRPVTRV